MKYIKRNETLFESYHSFGLTVILCSIMLVAFHSLQANARNLSGIRSESERKCGASEGSATKVEPISLDTVHCLKYALHTRRFRS
jgi:hypothetical protein